MRHTIALITTLAMFLIAGPGLAKGPVSATITGPGIDKPIELFDQREVEVMNVHIVDLIEQTGLWYAAPTLEPIDQLGGLGEPLVLAWGEGSDTIRQDIYLHAEGGPVIHTLEGQTALQGWGGDVTGWFAAPAELEDTLRALGVPADAPGGIAWSVPPVVLVVIALTVGIAAASRFVNSRLVSVVSDQ